MPYDSIHKKELEQYRMSLSVNLLVAVCYFEHISIANPKKKISTRHERRTAEIRKLKLT